MASVVVRIGRERMGFIERLLKKIFFFAVIILSGS